jgi:hypothetical protein
MRELLVLKNVAYLAKSGGGSISGINEVNLLDVGALAVLSNENTTVAYPNPSLADKLGVMFAVGQDSTKNQLGSKISNIIPRRGRVIVEKKVYSAPVKEVQAIGAETASSPDGVLSIPSTLVEGTIASIKILDITRVGIPAQKIVNVEYKVKAGDTAATVVAALVAKLNAHPMKFVTAAAVNTDDGILLTADDFGTKFSVAVQGIIQGSTIVNSMNFPANTIVKGMYSGYGTAAQIAALETEFSGYEGNTNRVHMPALFWTYQSAVDSSATYTTWAITWEDNEMRSFGGKPSNREELVIAAPSGASTLIATIDDILAEAFGKGTTTIEVGS